MTDPGLKKAYQKPSGHTDFRIALSTLETEIAKGNLSEKYKNIIKNPKNWSKISLPQKMKWARLAQMAGEMETAIAVFDNINKTSPEHIPGWQEHISLLMILGNRKQAAVITALAKSHIRKEDYDHLPSSNFINAKMTDLEEESISFEMISNTISRGGVPSIIVTSCLSLYFSITGTVLSSYSCKRLTIFPVLLS